MTQKANMIRQTIFKVEKEKEYTIDVDETTNMRELKKILANAAHLRKNSFKIYHQNKDYTNDFDEDILLELFPNEQKIYFTLIKIELKEEIEDAVLQIDNNLPCNEHPEKFQIFYCYTCNRSICKICLDLNHKDHDVKEKYDYLAPTNLLVEKIFKDAYQYIADENYDQSKFGLELEVKIKNVLMEQLKQILEIIGINLCGLVRYFVNQVCTCKKNINENIGLLKTYSIDAYKALKNDISTNQIIINDDIFLTLDKKIKEIEKNKEKLKESNKNFIEMNSMIQEINLYVEEVYNALFTYLESFLNQTKIEEIKKKIASKLIEQISKDDILHQMFEDITVKRKSLMKLNNHTSNSLKGVNDSRMEAQRNIKGPSVFNINNNLNDKNEKVLFGNKIVNTNINSTMISNSNSNNNIESNQYPLGNNNNLFTNTNYVNKQFNDLNLTEKNIFMPMNINQQQPNINQNSNQLFNEQNKNITNLQYETNKNFNLLNQSINQNPQQLNNNIYTNKEIIIDEKITRNNNNEINTPFPNNTNNNDNIIKEKRINPNNQNYSSSSNNISQTIINNNPSNTEIITKKIINTEHNTPYNINQNFTSNQNNTYSINQTLNMNPNMNINKNIIEEKTTIKKETNTVPQNIIGAKTTTIETINGIQTGSISVTKEITFGNNNNINTTSNNSNTLIKNTTNKVNNNIPNFLTNLNNAINNELNEPQVDIIDEEVPKTYIGDPNKNSIIKSKKDPINIIYPISNTSRVIIETSEGNSPNGKQLEKFIEFPVTAELTKFLEGNGFCNYKNKLYISGGFYKNLPSSFFIKYDPSYKTVIIMPPMKINKANHSMIGYDDKIYSIGGINNNKCEYFNIKEMKWEPIANLFVEERQFPMLYIYHNFLYAFGGLTSKNEILSTVERINLKNPKSKWELVTYTNPDNIDTKIYGCGIIPCDENSIFLFGGKNKDGLLKKVFKFNFSNNSFQKSGFYAALDLPVYFRENILHKLNNNQFGGVSESDEHRGIFLTLPSDS